MVFYGSRVDGVGDAAVRWLDSFFVRLCASLGFLGRRVSNVPNFCSIPVGPPVILAAVWTRNCPGAKSREILVYVDAS